MVENSNTVTALGIAILIVCCVHYASSIPFFSVLCRRRHSYPHAEVDETPGTLPVHPLTQHDSTLFQTASPSHTTFEILEGTYVILRYKLIKQHISALGDVNMEWKAKLSPEDSRVHFSKMRQRYRSRNSQQDTYLLEPNWDTVSLLLCNTDKSAVYSAVCHLLSFIIFPVITISSDSS